MELAESIKKAWTAVEDSGVPESMQELAFKEALRSLLGTTSSAPLPVTAGVPATAQPTSPGESVVATAGAVGGNPEEQAVMASVADHTGVPIEKLERVFHIEDGVVKISANHAALGKTAADKARATAQILTVVRKVGMGQVDTDFDIIREECQRKHFYDGKNFASAHMPGIEGFIVKGEGRSRRLEVRNTGLSGFPALIDKVLGES